MKRTFTTLSVCTLTVALASCGGSSSSSSSPAIDPDANLPDTGEPSEDGTTTNTPVTGGGLEVAAGDPVCASHTLTSATTTGNNVFAYQAAAGQCFGTKEAAADLDKRLVPVDVVLDLRGDATEQMLSVEPQARMVINPGSSAVVDAGTNDTFIVDVTNTHSAPICVHADEINILDTAGQVVYDSSVDTAGDQYQSIREDGTVERFEDCIPAGESRFVFGRWLTTATDFAGGVLPAYTRLQLALEVEVPGADAVAAEPLVPGEMTWSAYGPDEDSFGSYPVNTSLTVQNGSAQSVEVGSFGDVLYMDEENYLIHLESLSMDYYAKLTGASPSDEDDILAASGGIGGYATSEFFSIKVSGESGTGFDGPASQAVVYVEQQCVGELC